MPNAALALLSMLLVATPLAQATPVPARTAIPPVVWELIEFSHSAADTVEIAEPSRYTLQFQPDGKLAIGADCNQAVGTYTAENGSLDINVTVSTLALCPPDSQAEPMQALLDRAAAYRFDDDGTLLLLGDDGTLRLRASLTGVIWEWLSFRGGDGSLVNPERPADYTLTFLAEGKLAIQADCNRAMATYTADGPAIALAIGGVTRAECPPGSLAERYLRDLDDVSSHVFRDGSLYLALWADAGIMEFQARYDEPPEATPRAG